ncbi:MAG: hypothetical protein CSB15_00050 [Clostridiales bacterium]|nr:MAG: hypothetical protein CSB15_00050 [Clostridiales bacterium]
MENKFLNKSKLNLLWFFILFLFLLFIFALRLYRFQVKYHDVIKERIESRVEKSIVSVADRGTIFDRNGTILAKTVVSYDLYLDERLYESDTKTRNEITENVDVALKKISEIYPKVSYKELNDKVIAFRNEINTRQEKDRHVGFYILKDLPYSVAQKLKFVDMRYFAIKKNKSRIYPNKTIASKILGAVDFSQNGVLGIEAYYNKELKGKNGKYAYKSDKQGNKILLSGKSKNKPKKNGKSLTTTLDSRLQFSAEQVCRKYKKKFNAKKVIAIIQDSKTGEILAMADDLTYDSNDRFDIIDEDIKIKYEKSKDKSSVLNEMWKNKAISDIYGAGSIVKILTAAAVLDNKIVNKNTPFNCPGIINIDGIGVKCYRYDSGLASSSHGNLTFEEGLIDSCNVVFSRAVLKLGKNKFYDYLNKFGFLSKIDIKILNSNALPNPQISLNRDKKDVPRIDVAKMSFGYAMSITPLHVANIAMSISNDGVIIEPSIIKDIDGKKISSSKSRRVMSAETSREIKSYMKKVALRHKEFLQPKGYEAACKTGTSDDGKSDKDLLSCTVVSIVPADKPRVNIVVVVDEPKTVRKTLETAGVVSKELAENSMKILGVSASKVVENKTVVKVPNFVGKTIAQVDYIARTNGLKINIDYNGGGNIIKSQSQAAGSLINKTSVVELKVKENK